jgi:signal transduction histidine kinase
VGYWRTATGSYVDPAGRPWEEGTPAGRQTVALTRGGQPLAIVVRPGRGRPPGELREHLGPAARLAIDNERLRAETLAELADLRASRVRIVESADGTRRRLERDLHDGAQQRLLALAFEVTLARTELPEDLAGALDELADELTTTIDDVRELAHGIYPAELEEAGLGAALEMLADVSPVPLQVTVVGEPPAPQARLAYLLVQSAVEGAHDGPVAVTVLCTDGAMRLDVEGAVLADPKHCVDRVGALGGTLTTGPRRLRAEIPCA